MRVACEPTLLASWWLNVTVSTWFGSETKSADMSNTAPEGTINSAGLNSCGGISGLGRGRSREWPPSRKSGP